MYAIRVTRCCYVWCNMVMVIALGCFFKTACLLTFCMVYYTIQLSTNSYRGVQNTQQHPHRLYTRVWTLISADVCKQKNNVCSSLPPVCAFTNIYPRRVKQTKRANLYLSIYVCVFCMCISTIHIQNMHT